jgi:hypothetical protein
MEDVMAELSDRDRKAILGDNWRAISQPVANDTLSQVEQKLAAQKKSAVDQQFNALALLVLGLVAASASLYRAGAAPYEQYFGISLGIIALIWLAVLRIKKRA